MICVSIARSDQLLLAQEAGAQLLELRLDLMAEPPAKLFGMLGEGIRTVVTCRPEITDDSTRSRWLMEAIDLGASYVDLELESGEDFRAPLVEAAHRKGCTLIISHHDFQDTPGEEELARILDACYACGGQVAKIATACADRDAVLRLLSLYNREGRKVVLGMGPAGRVTRVLAPYLGSEFTFAASSSGAETAPGQLGFQQLKDIYKAIDAS